VKIAFVGNVGGGVDPYIRTTARYMLQQGHTVHVVYGRGEAEWGQEFPNLHIHKIAKPGNLHYYSARLGLKHMPIPGRIKSYERSVAIANTLAAIKAKHGLDLVELTEDVSHPALFADIPFIFKMHGSEWTFRHYCEDRKYFPYQVTNQRSMLLAARQCHSLSRSLADFITGRCNVPRDLIQVTPYPIDTEEFHPAEPPQPFPPFRLMAVGRLEKRKGTHTLVAALRNVWQHEPDTHLHLYGSNSDFGQAQIEEVIPASEHQGRIHFEGFVPRETLIERYQQVHVYVTPTRYETFGYTVLEAMACGRPVIAANIGPLPELVRHEETGWLVPRDDVDALAETIIKALQNPEVSESYGQTGRRFAERFALDKLLPQQVARYESLVSDLL
jgi:glycosyltransferase involved in cell wall biosynthesis